MTESGFDMKKFFLPFFMIAGLCAGCAQKCDDTGFVHPDLDKKYTKTLKKVTTLRIPAKHPRLFVDPDKKFSALPVALQSEFGKELGKRVVLEANKILDLPPEKRVMTGFRLLEVSRMVLLRITTLSMAWQITGKKEFVDRAVMEMCAAANFTDWNAEVHFLDTAEMCLALSIGYDWMYDLLTQEQRKLISTAIIEKALKPSFTVKKNWWIRCRQNWNQVCHAGLTAGALAVADLEPELADKTIRRAVECLPISMVASYYPNGAYSEGPTYWGYGTDFAVVMLALLRGAFDQDFGISDMQGFSRTGDFITAVYAPDGKSYSYSDGQASFFGSFFPLIWLNHHFNRPDFFTENVRDTWHAKVVIGNPKAKIPYSRLLPLSLLYLKDIPKAGNQFRKMFYSGDEADVPLVIFRAGIEKNDAYLGTKGGSPRDYHGHMDAGSFIYVAGGVRWVSDIGAEKYHHVESAGLNLWNYEQDSDRWKLFRLGTQGHSLLRIDQKQYFVDGRATYSKVSEESATLNMTSLYQGAASKVTRTFEFNGNESAVIIDRVEGARPGAVINWQITTLTKAAVSGGKLILTQDGKTLLMEKNTGKNWTVTPADKLTRPYDSPNPGVTVVSFDTVVPESGIVELKVKMSLQK